MWRVTDKREATEAEQWLDNFDLYLDGGVHGYYPACNDHTVPGELAKLLAAVRADARRQALEEAAALFAVTSRTHRHTVYADESERQCRRCDADDATARRIRSLMEPKEQSR
jgi:hypothetical protein